MIRLGRGQGCLLADTLRWIGFSEDDAGAGAPSRRQLTARPRRQPTGPRFSMPNALRTTRST